MLLSSLFAFYISLYFLRIHEYRPETENTNILFVTLALCLIIYLFKKEKNLRVVQTPFIIGFFIVALLSHASRFYLQGTIDTAEELIRLLALYFIACSLLVDKERLLLYFKLITLCAAIISLHGVNQVMNNGIGWTGMSMYRFEQVRYIGVFQDPNDMGMLLLITVPIAFYLIKHSNNSLTKVFWIIVQGINLYGIYLTDSRGTLLGLLGIIFLYAWTRLSRVLAITLGVIAVPTLVAATRLSTISTGDASAAGRIDAWGQGITMLKSNPIFGVGHGLFRDYHSISAHSSYVEVFSQTGLLGYFFWIGFVAMSAYGSYRFSYKFKPTMNLNDSEKSELIKYKALSTTILFSILAYMSTAFFLSRSIQPLLFLVCAMSAGLYYQLNEKFPDFRQQSFHNSFRTCVFLTIGSVLFVYVVIRVFW